MVLEIRFGSGIVFLFCFIALIVNELGSIQAVGRMISADHMERRTTREWASRVWLMWYRGH